MTDLLFFDNYGPFSLEEIIKISGCELGVEKVFDGSMLIEGVAPLEAAKENQLSFLSNKKYIPEFKKTKAGVCIVEKKYENKAPKNIIILLSDNPYKSYALIAQAFYPSKQNLEKQHAESAKIDASATVGMHCIIGENVIIEKDVIIGNNCKIDHNTVIKGGVIMGNDCCVGSSVTISHAIIKNKVIIHPGVRVGQDGFGFASDSAGHVKVPQLGRVLIGNDVEIGANTCIDRGSGHDTIIGDYCKIDNLVQIGHNAELGKGCLIVAQVGIAGSTKIGDFVALGGQAGVSGHLCIGSGVQVAAQSGIIEDIEAGQVVGGTPCVPIRQWHKQTLFLRNLNKRAGDE